MPLEVSPLCSLANTKKQEDRNRTRNNVLLKVPSQQTHVEARSHKCICSQPPNIDTRLVEELPTGLNTHREVESVRNIASQALASSPISNCCGENPKS